MFRHKLKLKVKLIFDSNKTLKWHGLLGSTSLEDYLHKPNIMCHPNRKPHNGIKNEYI